MGGTSWIRVALAVALSSSVSAAETFFYRELAREGQLYVFASAQALAAFEASGVVEAAIFRPGDGPRGENLVFDSEQAVALYDFRHGLPGPTPAAAPPGPKLSWKDGKTTLELDGAKLTLQNRVQVRWTHEDPPDAVRLPGTDAAGEPLGSFRIRRAKTKLVASAFAPELSFTLQMNWADAVSILEDAYLDWDASKNGFLQLRLGQFKVPFGRQELTSSGSQQFVDRSIVSREFSHSRDVGIEVYGQTAQGRIEYAAGLFNGNGRSRLANDNDAYQVDARLAINPNGDPGHSEDDFESKDRPLWGLAVGYEYDDRRLRLDELAEFRRSVWGIDGVFKYRGLFVTAEGYLRRLTPEEGDAFDSDGYFLQGGYRFARRWELAARWAWWDRHAERDGDERTELGGAVSYYHAKHALKAQFDLRRLEVGDARFHELRIQTQFVF